MSQEIINNSIQQIDKNVQTFLILFEKRIELIEQEVNKDIEQLILRVEYTIAKNEIELIPYVALLIKKAHLHYLTALFHASPQLFSIIMSMLALIEFVVLIGKILKFIQVIKVILDIIDILSIIWPELRIAKQKLLGNISEMSKKIGFGSDGLVHLLHSAEGGVSILGGLLGKDREWAELKFFERSITALESVSLNASMIASNPALVLDWAFNAAQRDTMSEINTWWGKKAEWIGTASDNAEKAIKKVDHVVDDLMELELNMPDIIRYFIPSWIGDSIKWADGMIDNTILPKLTEIGNTMTTINAQIEAQRTKAQELANRLAHPGEILNTLNELPEDEKIIQEDMLDEAVSGQFVRENEEDEVEMKPIWEGFQILLDALSEPPPTPTYLEIEDRPAPDIRFPEAVVYYSWDIYDIAPST